MRLILASKSAQDSKAKAVTGERLVNCYPVPAPEGAIGQFYIRNVPGTRDKATVPGPFLRAAAYIDGSLYVVSDGSLYRVDGAPVKLADLADDPNTTIAGNRNKVTIAAGGNYYVYDGTTITQPGAGRLVNVGSVAFLNQFTVLSEKNGREVEWTGAGLPASRNALYFATAEARDDRIVRLMEAGAYLHVFKERSTEVWSTTELGGASAIRRISGMVLNTGLLGFNLVTSAKGMTFFVGHDRVAYVMDGGQAQPVSTPPVDQALLDGEPTHCFFYEDRGHRFCVIRFADRPAWVYDASMGIWHERAEGVDLDPWDIIAAVEVGNRWNLFSRLGAVYTLGTGAVDATAPMRRHGVSRTLYNESDRFRINKLEFLGEFGRYHIEEQGPGFLLDTNGLPIRDSNGRPIRRVDEVSMTSDVPVRLMFSISRDGGRTYGAQRIKNFGRTGDYEARCVHRGLGQYRRMTVAWDMTDNVEVHLMSEALIA